MVTSLAEMMVFHSIGYGKQSLVFGQFRQPQDVGAPRRCKVPADASSAREIVGSSR